MRHAKVYCNFARSLSIWRQHLIFCQTCLWTGIILDYLHLVSEIPRPLLFLDKKKPFGRYIHPSETLIVAKFSAIYIYDINYNKSFAFTSCSGALIGLVCTRPPLLLLNHIIILGKQVIYQSRLKKCKPVLIRLKNKLKVFCIWWAIVAIQIHRCFLYFIIF